MKAFTFFPFTKERRVPRVPHRPSEVSKGIRVFPVGISWASSSNSWAMPAPRRVPHNLGSLWSVTYALQGCGPIEILLSKNLEGQNHSTLRSLPLTTPQQGRIQGASRHYFQNQHFLPSASLCNSVLPMMLLLCMSLGTSTHSTHTQHTHTHTHTELPWANSVTKEKWPLPPVTKDSHFTSNRNTKLNPPPQIFREEI